MAANSAGFFLLVWVYEDSGLHQPLKPSAYSIATGNTCYLLIVLFSCFDFSLPLSLWPFDPVLL